MTPENIPNPNPAPAPNPNPVPAPAPQPFNLPENWRDSLPADIKDEPSLKTFNDIGVFAKSFIHAQKQIGVDKVPIPNKHFTEEDWSNFYEKIGVPKDAKYYQLDVDKTTMNETLLNAFKETSIKEKLFPKQSQALLKSTMDSLTQIATQAREKQKTESESRMNDLKKEWGQAFDQNTQFAHLAFKKFGDESLKSFLDESGFGNDPRVIKMFSKVGEILREGTIREGKITNDILVPAEALKKANTIAMDSKHPYNDKKHPNHKAAIEEVEGLYKMAFPAEDK